MEIDTAARHRAPVLIVVANNGAWAIEVRDQQETHGKVVGTQLQFADHAAMARGLGLHAERVERAEDLPQAIGRALAHLPALLDVVVTPQAVSSDARSGLAWVPDLQPLSSGTTPSAAGATNKGESRENTGLLERKPTICESAFIYSIGF
ncbi:MAG: thiamine pyrophosphate-dependent enzyme [Limnohabitans sp.]